MTKNNQNIVIQALLEKKERLIEELGQVNDALKSEGYGVDADIQVESNTISTSNAYSDYNTDWSLSRKFVYLLKKHRRFLHFREAANMINGLEDTKMSDTELASKLSSGTQSLKSEGVIVKFQFDNNNKNSFWGTKNWLDNNGAIKDGHEYDTSYIYKKKTSSKDLYDIF